MVFSVWVLTILNSGGLRSPGMEGECSTTKRVNHGCMSPPQKKTTTQGLNDCCWWKHHACALNPTVSKIPLPFFHFTIFHPPPYAWEASWNLQPCYAVMPWRAEAIAMMIHLEAMGQPPLQWLQVDWWTPDWKKKMHLATLKLESKFKVPPPIFLGEGGRGEARVMFCSGQNPFRDLESGGSLNQPSLENCSKKKSGGHERIKPNTQRTPTTCFSSNFRFDVPNQGEKKHVLKQS